MEEIKGNNIGDYLENFVLNQIKMGLDTEKANTIIYLFNPAESYDLVTLQKFENCKLKENNFNFAPIMCIRGENRKINLLNSEFNIQNKELIGVNGTINQILNVSIFPAIYIINSKGRILERINGKYSFEKIKHIFCKL